MKPWVIAPLLVLTLLASDRAIAAPPLIARPIPMSAVVLVPMSQLCSMRGAVAHAPFSRVLSGRRAAPQRHSRNVTWTTVAAVAIGAYVVGILVLSHKA
jgi:hypothetical protein